MKKPAGSLRRALCFLRLVSFLSGRGRRSASQQEQRRRQIAVRQVLAGDEILAVSRRRRAILVLGRRPYRIRRGKKLHPIVAEREQRREKSRVVLFGERGITVIQN